MNKNFGLSSDQYQILETELKKLLTSKKKFQVSVFGSRAKGTEKKYSDIDLWVESDPALSSTEISLFLELIEESDLVIRVDLVTPENCLEEYRLRILAEKVFLDLSD